MADPVLTESSRIRTPRLVLRPMRRDDQEAMHRVFCDPEVMRFIPDGPQDLTGTERRVQSLIDHQDTHGFSKWAIVTGDGGEVIGDCGVQYLDRGTDIELGFHIARAHWGRGYATEAARAWLTWTQANRSERLVAIVYPENARSINVLRKLGLRYAHTDTYFGRVWDVWR